MTHEQKIERMNELVTTLQHASEVYYAKDREVMSNYTYDALYDELMLLEEETGVVLSGSPTVSVGYEAADQLPKEAHAHPMLSLNKTKDPEEIASFAGDHKTLLSWKMDGLTVVLTYEGGQLQKGVTRGNGIVGEVVTQNVRAFQNVPLSIPYQGRLIIRGEAIIHYSDFAVINEHLPADEEPFKNPRNLCSGAVRALDPSVTANRQVYLYVFSLVEAADVDFRDSHEEEFMFLRKQGFTVVPYHVIYGHDARSTIQSFSRSIPDNDFPTDGLVAMYDEISYGISLGTTAKFPRNAIAFKWEDETAKTVLLDCIWNASRTGRINPIAVFEPVELEGTTVERASVHNVSVVKQLQLGIGDELLVYKANMIIPQIAKNLTGSNTLEIPSACPVCGGKTEIRSDSKGVDDRSDAALVLFCTNGACPAKQLQRFVQFVSRDAMNIEGLSEATIEKMIAAGLVEGLSDFFYLKQHKDVLESMEGFGEKSAQNLLSSCDAASRTQAERVLYGLGIPGVGVATAKIIAKAFHDDLQAFMDTDEETLSAIPSIGPTTSADICRFIRDPDHRKEIESLLHVVTIEHKETAERSPLSGMTFVITGSLATFASRRDLVAFIEEQGGRVSSAVSNKTTYLINNDTASTSGKNKKAAQLGIPILSEEAFMELVKEEDHANTRS